VPVVGGPTERSGAPTDGGSRDAARERVAAVLLAAGEGTRFHGGPKLLWPFLGRPLVAWALDAAVEAGLDAVVLVTGAVDLDRVTTRGGAGAAVVHNPRWAAGQASSLACGIAWCADRGFAAAVVGLGDQPLVPASAWRAVGRPGGQESRPVVTASYGGRRRPPVRLHRSVWSLLSTDGDEGARELMRRRPDLVREVACEGSPADVDTLEDLRRLEAAAGRNAAARDLERR